MAQPYKRLAKTAAPNRPAACVALATFLAVMATFAPSASRAAAITETFTFGPIAGYNVETGSTFAAFDPSLGTLTSVTYGVGATVTFAGGASAQNVAAYVFSFSGPTGGSITSSAASFFGNGTTSASVTALPFGNPFINAYFGPGLVTPSVTVTRIGGPASISTTFPTEKVTYTYTPTVPVTPVPEPASLALLGAGLLGFGFVRRRKPRKEGSPHALFETARQAENLDVLQVSVN